MSRCPRRMLHEAAPEITLYDGINSEMQLIHKMVEILVEDKTDAEVTIKDQMIRCEYGSGSSPGRNPAAIS